MRTIRRAPITFDNFLLRNTYASCRPTLIGYASLMLDSRSATVVGGLLGGGASFAGVQLLGNLWPLMLLASAVALGVLGTWASNATAKFDNSPIEPGVMAVLLREASWLTRNRIGELMELDPDGVLRHRHLLVEIHAIASDLSTAAERPHPLPFWTQS